jgi:acetamidase/formamidase
MRLRVALIVAVAAAVATASLRAETHRFVPTVFANTLSGAHPPVLRIKSGDRVITTTVDDLGVDADGKTLAQGPNPRTGPFFVEGAEPGDMLVVTIEKLETNRTTGSSPSTMAPAAVDSGAVDSKRRASRVPWTIDKANGVVRFDLSSAIRNVDWRTRYLSPTYELPLRPALSSLGVAPAKTEALNTTVPGRFGGNLDHVGLTAGARIMLPVSEPGALLVLGHGHARDGDGEAGGSGIETSMDVEFSVELIKKKAWPHSSVVRPSTVAGEFEILWPRVETDAYVMAIGSATSLQQALQHATTELHHWLDDDYGFSERSLSIFLSQAIEYEIANAIGPDFTVLAKVRKSYLPRPVAAE